MLQLNQPMLLLKDRQAPALNMYGLTEIGFGIAARIIMSGRMVIGPLLIVAEHLYPAIGNQITTGIIGLPVNGVEKSA